MSAFRTLFRHCPSCGRRFEIRLTSTKEVSDVSEAWKAGKPIVATSGRRESMVMLEGERPVTVEIPETEEIKEFMYNYKCKYCGHEWSEVQSKSTVGAGNPEYKGD
jgi:hypothetical protein